MIAKTLKTINGPLRISIPSTIAEVTLGMLIKMQDDLSDLEVIAILAEMDKEELYNVINMQDFTTIFQEHILSLIHQIKYNCDNLPLPQHIFIAGKRINVISNLSIEPAGAFLECRNIIAEEINLHIKEYGEDDWKENFKPSLQSTAQILANYLYCPTTGLPYDDTKIEAFKLRVLRLSITITAPLAKYFFLKYPNLLTQKIGYLKGLQLLWKRKQALRRLRRSGT